MKDKWGRKDIDDGNIFEEMKDNQKDILKKIEEEVARFRNLTLNANVISKNYIEISTFNYRVNLLEEEIKKIFQEELKNE